MVAAEDIGMIGRALLTFTVAALLSAPLSAQPQRTVTLDEAILKDGQAIGYISSGGYAHHVGKSMAMGYVETAYAEAGTVVDVEILGEMYPAEVQGAPLYDPSGAKMRS